MVNGDGRGCGAGANARRAGVAALATALCLAGGTGASAQAAEDCKLLARFNGAALVAERVGTDDAVSGAQSTRLRNTMAGLMRQSTEIEEMLSQTGVSVGVLLHQLDAVGRFVAAGRQDLARDVVSSTAFQARTEALRTQMSQGRCREALAGYVEDAGAQIRSDTPDPEPKERTERRQLRLGSPGTGAGDLRLDDARPLLLSAPPLILGLLVWGMVARRKWRRTSLRRKLKEARDRRAEQRRACERECHVRIGDGSFVPTTCLNISCGGCKLMNEEEVDRGDPVAVLVLGAVRRGRIVWIGQNTVGVVFDESLPIEAVEAFAAGERMTLAPEAAPAAPGAPDEDADEIDAPDAADAADRDEDDAAA